MAIQGCKCKEPIHVGMVVDMFVKQSSCDDYFYAVVFNGSEVKELQYESTAFGSCVNCNGCGEARIDASEETMKSYHAYCAKKNAEHFAHELHYGRAIPKMGDSYIVVRGRKVAKGTTGTIRQVRQTVYGHMANLGGTWVDTKNLAPVVAA